MTTPTTKKPKPAPTNTAPKLDPELAEPMRAGEWDRALAVAARFPYLGAQAKAIRTAHEAVARPDFYRQMGKDIAALRQAGIDALRARWPGQGA